MLVPTQGRQKCNKSPIDDLRVQSGTLNQETPREFLTHSASRKDNDPCYWVEYQCYQSRDAVSSTLINEVKPLKN